MADKLRATADLASLASWLSAMCSPRWILIELRGNQKLNYISDILDTLQLDRIANFPGSILFSYQPMPISKSPTP